MKKVSLRTFCLELKHRPADDETGERETLIHSLELTVPRLANSSLETRWAMLSAWNMFASEYAKEKEVNQIFIFNANWQELLARLELNKFIDEECETLNPPDPKQHDSWTQTVQKQFTKLYGMKLDDWFKLNPAGEFKIVN